MSMFYGYYHNFFHVGFVMGEADFDNIKLKEYIQMNEISMLDASILDVICMIDIILTFFTAFLKDARYQNYLPDIFMNYVGGFFFFDLTATLPCLIYGEDSLYYPLKLIRFVHVLEVYEFITEAIFKGFLKKIGVVQTTKVSYVFDLLLYLLSSVHFLGCMWIYLGKKLECSWIRRCPVGDITVANDNNFDIYITSTYWVITTLTTVGYGDYKGYTPQEYLFQIGVEFLGIGVFSFLMNSINSLFDHEVNLKHLIDKRNEDVEAWLR
jgi:hypothetical protein